ncbi:hypothetical protein [Candidatus Nitrospira bockiana]
MSRRDRCQRCGGLMVQDFVRDTNSLEWRCVMCGERVDAVILAHRAVGACGSAMVKGGTGIKR